MQPANGEITFDLTTIKIKDFSKVIMPPPPPTDFTTVISKEKTASPIGIADPESQKLSESGDYLISLKHLFSTQFSDEEQILNLQ